MKIAILGGGLTGLTAAYYLSKKNYQITVFEKEKTLGGLASGFRASGWDWFLERTYHHIFYNDSDILNFAEEIGFDDIFFQTPETASLYSISKLKIQNSKIQSKNQKYLTFPLDTPFDFLKLPLLDYPDKIRSGLVLAFLKISPYFSLYEKVAAEDFLQKTMGEKAWNILWKELFRKKFGKYTENILASFIWARIKKRTKKLGYIEGGFQTLIDYLVKKLKSLQVNVLTNFEIKEIRKKGEKYMINNQLFDKVISTLPTPILIKLAKNIFPAYFPQKLRKLKYLHALTLVLETKEPLLKKTYWLNISVSKIPIMVIVQHTNFIDSKYYGGNHLIYLAWYLKKDDKLFNMAKEELVDFIKPHLKILNTKYLILNTYYFKSPFAQPIFDKEFVKNKPNFETPAKNFFIANLDMTYPYDRGTNYAVKLGKEVSRLL